MANNKTNQNKCSGVHRFDNRPEPCADAKELVKIMQKAAGKKPTMWDPSIMGFGSHYVYDSGREGDMPFVALSPRKAATVMYGLSSAEALLPKLGKHTRGKGCIYIKKLADVDQKVLEAMVAKPLPEERDS